jgi:hypothetical protein
MELNQSSLAVRVAGLIARVNRGEMAPELARRALRDWMDRNEVNRVLLQNAMMELNDPRAPPKEATYWLVGCVTAVAALLLGLMGLVAWVWSH